MSRQTVSLRKALTLTGFYLPFTWYFFLFAVSCWLGYKWLLERPIILDSAYNDIFNLLLKTAFWFCSSILLIALISVIVSFLFFAWKKRKNKIDFKVDSKQEMAETQSTQEVQLYIHPIIKPFLGFIKIRLQYDNENYSDKFSLVEQPNKKNFNTIIEGVYHWSLPEIKEYQIEKAIIYFEDFFQFFSFAISINTSNRFYTQPKNEPSKNIKLSPRKTEEANTRIDEIKKVQGEYLSYKNFETNDDVRRIVWKIYAKNKDLVVRVPEILDPYASHIYLYASFFSSFNIEANDVVQVPFLNYYKTMVWSVYRQLIQQGVEVRFIADQNIQQNNLSDEQQLVKYAISTSHWQAEKDLKNYVKISDASIIIISSLSDLEQVKEMIDKYGNNILFVFIELTNSLHKQHIGDWLQWLFVQQEKDEVAVYKTNWSLSLLRPKFLQNEKQLKKILEQYQKSALV
ncbi:MAG: DUF58 domain-containing protein [Chitinophagaceae bacterium]